METNHESNETGLHGPGGLARWTVHLYREEGSHIEIPCYGVLSAVATMLEAARDMEYSDEFFVVELYNGPSSAGDWPIFGITTRPGCVDGQTALLDQAGIYLANHLRTIDDDLLQRLRAILPEKGRTNPACMD